MEILGDQLEEREELAEAELENARLDAGSLDGPYRRSLWGSLQRWVTA